MRAALFIPLPALFIQALLVLGPVRFAEGKPTWKPIFNGRTLEPDWYKVGDQNYWSVDAQDSAIVGSSGGVKAPRSLLATTKTDWDQFTVKYAYRLKAGCSGFFFRVNEDPATKLMAGAQVEAKIENGKLTEVGSIYVSPAPGWVAQHPAAWSAKVAPNPDAYQQVILTVKKPFVYVNVNGAQAVGETNADSISAGAKRAWDYAADAQMQKPGHLALQIHDGEVMDVKFKDIMVLEGCGDPASPNYDGDFVKGFPKQAAVYQDNGTCAGTAVMPGPSELIVRRSTAREGISVETAFPGPHSFELLTLDGKILFSAFAPGSREFRLSIPLKPGIYLGRILAPGHQTVRRILIP